MTKGQEIALRALGKAIAAILMARGEGVPNEALIVRTVCRCCNVFNVEKSAGFVADVAITEISKVTKDWPF